MAIIQFNLLTPGLVGVAPRRVEMVVTDNLAAVTTAGYLNRNGNVLQGFSFYPTDVIDMIYSYVASTNSGTYEVFTPSIASNGTITLAAWVDLGNVVLPVVSNDFANFSGTTGLIADAGYSPSDATKTKVVMAGSATVANNIAHFIDITGTIDDTAANVTNLGNISAGASGTAGNLVSFPATNANGSLIVSALNAGGAFNTTVRNSTMGQSSVISIPDPGAATANFLLDTGASNIIAKQQFVGISDVLTFGTGTWTVTRIAQGNYVSRHTAADETSIIAVDITPIIVVAAAKGFRLDSFDYIYSIGTLAMDAHSLTLDRIAYANNVAVSVTSIAITATLATATQANPYVTNCTVTTPAFDVTADSKYVIEITANNAATSAYDFYGVMLRFSQTIG